MTSKKKPNGATSVDQADLAMKKAGIDVRQMFYLAPHVPGKFPEGFSPTEEARKFIRYKKEGITGYPDYGGIPQCVLTLVSKIHSTDRPQQLCNDLRTKMHTRAVRMMRQTSRSAAVGVSAAA